MYIFPANHIMLVLLVCLFANILSYFYLTLILYPHYDSILLGIFFVANKPFFLQCKQLREKNVRNRLHWALFQMPYLGVYFDITTVCKLYPNKAHKVCNYGPAKQCYVEIYGNFNATKMSKISKNS